MIDWFGDVEWQHISNIFLFWTQKRLSYSEKKCFTLSLVSGENQILNSNANFCFTFRLEHVSPARDMNIVINLIRPGGFQQISLCLRACV